MIASSLMLGAAVAWLAASAGGQHRDNSVAHGFWRHWDVDRMFFIREFRTALVPQRRAGHIGLIPSLASAHGGSVVHAAQAGTQVAFPLPGTRLISQNFQTATQCVRSAASLI